MTITVGCPQTNRKTDTGKTLKPWPVLVDHYTTHSLYAWIKKYGPDSSTNKEQSDAQAEIRRLQKELKRVTDERDILKKAAAYFAKLSD